MWAIFTTIISWVWNGIQAVGDAALIALEYAYTFLKKFASAIWDAARFTWEDVVKPIGAWLDAAYQRLKAVYDAVIKPALDWLGRVTSAIRNVYNTVLRPILSTIDNLRRVLAILASLHVAFAQQLDDALTALEKKITGPLQLVISVVNGIANQIEKYVLTVDNLFVQATHLASIRRDLQPIVNLHWDNFLRDMPSEMKDGPTGPVDFQPPNDQLVWLDAAMAGDVENSGVDIEQTLAVLDVLEAA